MEMEKYLSKLRKLPHQFYLPQTERSLTNPQEKPHMFPDLQFMDNRRQLRHPLDGLFQRFDLHRPQVPVEEKS